MRWLALALLAPWLATAAEVSLCFNYGCQSEASAVVDEDLLAGIAASLAGAADAAEERRRLAAAIGRLYRLAGRQTPIGADRAGDYLDAGAYGRMDCIDHATSTTRLLRMLEGRGMLRFHRVLEQRRRTRLLLFQHFSAVLEEVAAVSEGDDPRRYAIDSWFVEQGEPAVVLPLDAWLDGEGPHVR